MPTATIPGINAMMEGGKSERDTSGTIHQRSSRDGEHNIWTADGVNDQYDWLSRHLGWGSRIVQSRRHSIGQAIKQRRTQHVMGIRGTTGRVP